MISGAPYILWYEETTPESAASVGGKFGSLAEMANSGFGVPAAFAVTTDAFAAFIDAAGLAGAARETHTIDPDDLEAIEEASQRMTAAIEHGPMPAPVATAITDAYLRLGRLAGADDVPVAVRSSGVAEDLAGASFAGQYETYLWVHGIERVLEHVRRCWAGAFSPAVLTYRPAGGVAGGSATGMAVVVQRMVEARAAGVAFTLDPVTGDRSKIVIEATWGLGEGVVGGEITPDRFRVDKVTLEILERVIALKEREYRLDAASGVGLHPVELHLRAVQSLDDEQIEQLAALAKRIERHRGAPQDIEWAVDQGGNLHVLQVRPETVWSTRRREAAAPSGDAMELVMGAFMRAAGPGPAGRDT
ncbi:MAG TPA: PEP/pyruvate-binding domain-containing protein [Thermoleophilia bacterium]|nr:PEP/pyruvate-binding domain-containing protein [Thermoleophilia bacterium]